MKTQIEFLEKHGVKYTIEEGKIKIGGHLYLRSLTSLPENALHGVTVGGSLYLRSLTSLPENALHGVTIGCHLYLNSLTSKLREKAIKSVLKLQEGYNKERNYCYFDGILRKVLGVSNLKGYTIYTTPFDYVVQNGEYTAHGKTVRKAIEDLEFKIISEKLKKEPIKKDTIITPQYYRVVTGACELGVKNWIDSVFKDEKEKETIIQNGIKASELLGILEKNNAYGLERFKQLVTF